MTLKNFSSATSKNIKTVASEKDSKEIKTISSTRTPSSLQRSNTKTDLTKKNISSTTQIPDKNSLKTPNSIPTSNVKTTDSITPKQGKVDKEVLLSNLEIDTNDLIVNNDTCINTYKKDSDNTLNKTEDINKEIICDTKTSIKEEIIKDEIQKPSEPSAAGAESSFIQSFNENTLTPDIHENYQKNMNLQNEEISQLATLNLKKTKFSDLLVELKAVKIFSFLTKRENLLCTSMNKLMGKNSLTYLYQEIFKDLEDSDYKLSQYKLKNYNDLHIPDEGFPAFVMSRGANRAIDLLNENIYNKIFTQAQVPTDDVKLIYRIFFFLINKGSIAIIEDQNEFWSECSSYIMKEGNGKTGKLVLIEFNFYYSLFMFFRYFDKHISKVI